MVTSPGESWRQVSPPTQVGAGVGRHLINPAVSDGYESASLLRLLLTKGKLKVARKELVRAGRTHQTRVKGERLCRVV